MPGVEIDSHAVRDADALIVRTRTRCDAALLEGSRVKLVGTATIGTEHIDTYWCRAHSIRVVSAPGCNAPAVMQYVACSLHAAGFDPRSHTLGVVGKGHIGSLVMELYRRAGARVLVCDPPRVDAGFTDEDYLPLEQLLSQSDAVTLHVPGGKADSNTYHLINPENFGLMRPSAILINASRGNVVAPSILLGSRKGSRLLIIDTWPFEDPSFVPQLLSGASRVRGFSRPGVVPQLLSGASRASGFSRPEAAIAAMVRSAFIATPHIAGYSADGKRRATAAMLAALGITESELQCSLPEQRLPASLEEVIVSYNPLADSAAFKAAPADFERLRNTYPLR